MTPSLDNGVGDGVFLKITVPRSREPADLPVFRRRANHHAPNPITPAKIP